MQKKTLISIINWNNSQATNICLSGIAKIEKSAQPDVYLTDNNSQVEKLSINQNNSNSLKSFKVNINPTNKGFAGGHNDTIRYALRNGYDYVCLLNNDTEILDVEVFEKLISALEARPNSVAAAPTILHTLEPPTIWYGGGKMDTKRAHTQHENVNEPLETVLSKNTTEVSFLTGCCLMISLKSGLDSVLLSEDYFLYWEDADWCARMLQNNKSLLYVPQAKILHKTSSSLGVKSAKYSYYNIRNRLLFAKRWSKISKALPDTVWTSIKIVILSLKRPLSTPNTIFYVLRALLDGLRNKTGELR